MSAFNKKKKRYHKSTGYHRACATVSKVRFVHSSVWKEVQRKKRTGLIFFGSSAAEKGPFSFVFFFFFKIFLHAFYRTDMNLMLIFFWFFQKSCLTQYSVSIYSISLVTLHSLPPSAAPFPTYCISVKEQEGFFFLSFLFYKKGSYMQGSDMEIQSLVKGWKVSPGRLWININRKQEYDTDSALTGGNHHKRHVWGRECDSGRVAFRTSSSPAGPAPTPTQSSDGVNNRGRALGGAAALSCL